MNDIISYGIKNIFKYSNSYKRIEEEVFKVSSLSKDKIDDLNNKRLKKIVEYSYKNVPYYKRIFDENGISYTSINSKEDLKQIPLLTKKDIRDNYKDLISRKAYRYICNEVETSGTSGEIVKLKRDINSIMYEEAFISRFINSMGYKDKEVRRAIFRGFVFPEYLKKKKKYFSNIPFSKDIIFSSYDLNSESFEYYLKKLEEFKPNIIFAYPSVITHLIRLMDAKNYRIKIDAIYTSSENLLDTQRSYIENYLECKIFDWYGQGERVGAISQCSEGKYHIIEDYSIVELQKSEFGIEIIGTGLFNYAMPLLRYKTNDYVVLNDKETCKCGSSFKVLKSISGRNSGYIIAPDNKKISAFLLDDFVNRYDNVLEYQIIQNNKYELSILLVVNRLYSRHNEDNIKSRIKNKISHDININIEYTKMLTRGANGKVCNRFLVNE